MILIIYLVSLFCTVAMLTITSWVRFVFCAAAFIGYVAVCVIAVVKIIRHFKDGKKADIKNRR